MAETMHDTARLDAWDGDAHDLWLVTAVIQPFKLDAVTLALEALPDFGGMTVSDCRGFGHGKVARERSDALRMSTSGEMRTSAGGADAGRPTNAENMDYARKIRIDVAVAGQTRGMEIARTIARSAHTGRRGDGKVFISRLAGVAGIRAFDVDHDAL